ncbi:MAG TPA: hypothetical protein VKR60_13735 [Candidatus Sulfotelmatobacter sp.]|nr:hypothetical protein [Candidatus Sulfotelmatobacter sp.]
MRPISRFFLFAIVVASASLFVAGARAQDEPSLGDVARQSRQQKQQKDAPAKSAQLGNNQGQNAQNQSSQNKDAQSKDAQSEATTNKDAQGKAPQNEEPRLQKASHVITDDELPQHAVAGVKLPATATSHSAPGAPDPAFGGKMSADDLRSQIQDQKSAISAMQTQINELNDSIHFAPGNCVSNCVQWNEDQQAKQRQVEEMRSELDNAKQALEQMQDYARKMGFGSSVYEPEQ